MNNDLISRSALKKCARVVFDKDLGRLRVVDVSDIDNAPTVSFMIDPDYVTELQNRNEELIKQLEEAERPQGEWISKEETLKILCEKCPVYNCVSGCNSYRSIEKMSSVQSQRPTGDLANEVWKLYEKHHSHLATYVMEFGYELKDLLGKYQKGGAE